MKPTRLITGLVLALSISVAPAIAAEPTPVVATSAEMATALDAANDLNDAVLTAKDAVAMVTEAMKAASAAADAAKTSALAAKAAVEKLNTDTTAFLDSFKSQLSTVTMIIKKIAVKLKIKA